MRVLEVGVCGTDREISEGLFGVPADGSSLVLGHESLAVVERDGHGFSKGDLVTATVRRSCRHCLACAEGAPDSCLTGDYVERGITRLDGFARELVAEDPAQVIPIPATLGTARRARRADLDLRARDPPRADDRRPPALAARARARRRRRRDRRSSRPTCCGSRASRSGRPRSSRAATLVSASGAHYVSTAGHLAHRPARGDRRLRPRHLGGARRAADGRQRSACCAAAASRACSASTGARSRSSIDGPVLGLDAMLENRVALRQRQRAPPGLARGRRVARPRARALAGAARGVRRPARAARPLRGGVRLPRRQGDARARRNSRTVERPVRTVNWFV